jgi:HipA-like protein
MKRFFKSLWDEFEAWGIRAPRAGTAQRRRIQVLAPVSGGAEVLVGALSEEGGEFVFRYAEAYRVATGARPLPAFPDLSEEYRSRELFPFFAVRLPPFERDDVKAALERLHVQEHDSLSILGLLARKGIANPYEFRLAD